MDTLADDTSTESMLQADIDMCQKEEYKWRKRRIRTQEALDKLKNRRCDDGIDS